MKKLLLTFIMLASLMSFAGASDQLFDGLAAWMVQGEPQGVCIADFNGDGINDIAAGNYYDNSVSVLFGNGDGSFQPPNHYDGQNCVYDVVAGNITAGDNDIDLLVQYCSSEIYALTNDGSGGFSAPAAIGVVGGVYQYLLADVDKDNNIDLVMTNYDWQFDSMTVMFNDGAGNFGSPARYHIGVYPRGLCVGDFDGDTYPDIATVTHTDTLSVFINAGDGSFGTATYYELSETAEHICAADYDGDTHVDLAMYTRTGTKGVRLYVNDGSGGFSPGAVSGQDVFISDMETADLDGDGDFDLVTCGDSVMVLCNDGTGTFTLNDNYYVGDDQYYLALGQLDNSAPIDIVTSLTPSSDSGFVVTLFNTGDAEFVDTPEQPVIDYLETSCTADFDDDGDLDLATISYWLDSLVILTNDGFGTFTEKERHKISHRGIELIAADLTGDNIADLAVGYSDVDSSFIHVLLNNGNATFNAPVKYIAEARPNAIFAGDLDGDTHTDLAVANRASASVSLFFNNGSGNMGTATNISVGGGSYDIAGGELLNTNGYIDLVIADYANDRLQVLHSDGAGGYPSSEYVTAGEYPYKVLVEDLDNDGDNDIAASNYYSGDVSIFENSNKTSFLSPVNIAVGYEPEAMCAGQFNADGLKDIAVIVAGSYSMAVLMNGGSMSFDAPRQYVGSYDAEGILAADLDDDSDVDIMVSDYDKGGFKFYWNRTNMSVGIEEPFAENLIPQSCHLAQNYPNPFNPTTMISFSLPERSEVALTVYNILGQEVTTLVDEVKSLGTHFVIWDGTDQGGHPVASGIYFYQMRAGDTVESRKMILLR